MQSITRCLSVGFFTLIITSPIFFFVPTFVAGATYYIDATSGNDSNDGLSVAAPWQSISKVNSTTYSPGDSILFKRGETWIGNPITLTPSASGTSDSPITYGAYGSGDAPVLTTAMSLGSTSDWSDEGSNIWSTNVPTTGSELVSNGSFESNTTGWNSYCEASHSAACSSILRTTTAGEYDSGSAGAKMTITGSGSVASDGQLVMNSGFSVTAGKWYRLTFRAKASSGFTLASNGVYLMKNGSPYTSYFDNTISAPTITTSWATTTVYYHANVTTSDARLTFYFGGTAPAGSTLYIDSVSVKEMGPDFLPTDVGNLIMASSTIFGVKKWTSSALSSQGDYWYDIDNHLLKMHSVSNPGAYYSGDIRAVLDMTMIDFTNRSHLMFENMHISMTNMGFNGGTTDDVIIQNNDISYIGGADIFMDGRSPAVRYGNGIQLWINTNDITVRNNRVWEVYDTALTSQGTSGSQSNLLFYNNVLWDNASGLEWWNQGSLSSNIIFENNTIVNSGDEWSYNQRPNPDGWAGGIGFSFGGYLPTVSTGLSFQNNSIVDPTGTALAFCGVNPANDSRSLDYNYYRSDSLAKIATGCVTPTETYTEEQFLQWQQAHNKDIHSFADSSAARFAGSANDLYIPAYDSPMIDMGTTTSLGRTTDIFGNPIYGTPDAGAYEYQPPYAIDTNPVSQDGYIRVYGDGKYRYLAATSTNLSADFEVAPQGGWSSGNYAHYYDVLITDWETTGTYAKSWTASSSVATATVFAIGDLVPDAYYTFSADGAVQSTAQADANGRISYTYSSGWSTHSFDVNAATTSCALSLDQSSIYYGQSGTLTWTSSNGLSASFDQGIGPVALNGSASVSPAVGEYTYTLTIAGGGDGANATCSAILSVKNIGNGPPVGITSASGARGQAAALTPFVPASHVENLGTVTATSAVERAAPPIPADTAATTSGAEYKFTRNLSLHNTGLDVRQLQTYLNTHRFMVARTGAGSPGEETDYFGVRTYLALIAFQNAHAADILAPVGLTRGSGYFGPSTRSFTNR